MAYPSLYSPYGSLTLTDSSPVQSFVEPLTLEEVKEYGIVGNISPDQEPLIETILIPAAREMAEILQGRDLIQKQYDLALDYWPFSYAARWNQLELHAPLISVDLFRYRDFNGTFTTLVENTDYIVDTSKHPGVVAPMYGRNWPSFTPWPSSSILIRFTSGISPSSAFWSDAGARIKNGMNILISEWFNNRLPFSTAKAAIQEYPFSVTSCLRAGRREIVY